MNNKTFVSQDVYAIQIYKKKKKKKKIEEKWKKERKTVMNKTITKTCLYNFDPP